MVHYTCPGLRNKTCKPQVTGTEVKTLITRREVPGDRHGLGAITLLSGKAAVPGAWGWGRRSGSAQRSHGSEARAGPTAPIGFFPFRHEAPPISPCSVASLKKKEERLQASSHRTRVQPPADVAGRPAERPARRPHPPAAPAQPPPQARAVVRGERSQAHARGGRAPARSHFRRAGASAVPGRCSARRPAVRAGDADWRSRETPEAGLCRLPRERQVRGRGPETRAGPSFSQ